jgi:predicted RNA-binding protein
MIAVSEKNLYYIAVRLIAQNKNQSVAFLQKYLRIRYTLASRFIKKMIEDGFFVQTTTGELKPTGKKIPHTDQTEMLLVTYKENFDQLQSIEIRKQKEVSEWIERKIQETDSDFKYDSLQPVASFSYGEYKIFLEDINDRHYRFLLYRNNMKIAQYTWDIYTLI